MLRRHVAEWQTRLPKAAATVVATKIAPDEWYSMEAFEQLGLCLLRFVVGGEHDAIRLWGRYQVQGVLEYLPDLKNPNDPRDSVMRFGAFLSSLFDFPAVVVDGVDDEEALITVDYGMSADAEEAATWQTVGFFEELVTASGGREATGRLQSRSWLPGEPRTTFVLTWRVGATSPRPFLQRPHVLVVDDEPLVGRGLARVLAQVAEVTHAVNATEALRLLESRPFDAVLSDFQMPERDGLSLLEEISSRWPALKRVLHSGSIPPSAMQAVARGVVHELIEKPAPRDVLVRAVSTPPRRS